MTIIADLSNLEREVLCLIARSSGNYEESVPQCPTRQSALLMLSRCAQSIEEPAVLLNEAAILATTTLNLHFVIASEVAGTPGQLSHRISRCPGPDSRGELLYSETTDDSPTASIASFALQAAHPVIVANLERETRFSDRPLLGAGARNGIVCPVLYQDRKFGAIGVFSHEAREYTQDDILFVHSLSLLLGPALAHRRAEKALADQSKFLSSTIDSLESVVLLLNDDGDILRLNQACRSLGGFKLEEVRKRSLWGTFLLPEETPLIHDVFSRLRAGEPSVKCESFLLTKRGDRRRISWVFSRLPFKTRRGPSVIASGIDITQQHKAFERLDELSSMACKLDAKAATKLEQAARPRAEPLKDHRPPSQRSIEYRAYPRRSYPYVQAIGICRDGTLPKREEFFDVRCRDISSRGFSYVTDVAPDFFEFVVTFGSPPAQLYLRSRIVHVSPLVHEGRNCLLVGCEYIERVEVPS